MPAMSAAAAVLSSASLTSALPRPRPALEGIDIVRPLKQRLHVRGRPNLNAFRLVFGDGHECSSDWIHRHSVIRIVYGQERIDRDPTVPHTLLTVHVTVPTMSLLSH